MPSQDILKVGRFCALQDPQGAMINAITYVQEVQTGRWNDFVEGASRAFLVLIY